MRTESSFFSTSCIQALGPQQSLFAVNLEGLGVIEPWEEDAECTFDGDLAC